MPGSLNNRPDDALQTAALAWHVRLDDASATEADWLAFESWLAEPGARDAYAALDQLDLQLAELAELQRDDVPAAPLAEPAERQVLPFLRRARVSPAQAVGWGSALAAIAAALLLVFMMPPAGNEPVWETQLYAAPAGEDRLIALADGSEMHLNRGAVAMVRWSDVGRTVDLQSGEAAFHVAHDEARPFTVVAGDVLVRDVGTEFNVLRTDGDMVVTVREGVVDVLRPEHSASRVSRGMALQLDTETYEARLAPADVEAAFAWQQGHLVYSDAQLGQVLADIARYGASPVRPADASVAELRFSGVLSIDNQAAMLERLSGFLPISVSSGDDGYLVAREISR